ncbi:MAG: hypothetical protein AB1586_01010 [Pseudomonadota bacterium]
MITDAAFNSIDMTARRPAGLPTGSAADPTGRSRLTFARYKGEAEKALLAAEFPGVYIFRSADIYPVSGAAARLKRGIVARDARSPVTT